MHLAISSYCGNSVTDSRCSRCRLLEVFDTKTLTAMTLDFILLYQVCLQSWSFLALQYRWVSVSLRPVRKLTIRIHLLKTKVGREWERETARLTEREGGKEGRERDRHRESEGEAERVREREDRSSPALQKCTELLKSLTRSLRIVVCDWSMWCEVWGVRNWGVSCQVQNWGNEEGLSYCHLEWSMENWTESLPLTEALKIGLKHWNMDWGSDQWTVCLTVLPSSTWKIG